MSEYQDKKAAIVHALRLYANYIERAGLPAQHWVQTYEGGHEWLPLGWVSDEDAERITQQANEMANGPAGFSDELLASHRWGVYVPVQALAITRKTPACSGGCHRNEYAFFGTAELANVGTPDAPDPEPELCGDCADEMAEQEEGTE